MRKHLLSVIFLFLFSFSNAQRQVIDSLQKVLTIQREDTSKVNTLLRLSFIFRQQGNVSKVAEAAQDALLLAQKLKYDKGIGTAHMEMGLASNNGGNFTEALNCYNLARQSFRKIDDKRNVALTFLYSGNACRDQQESIKNYSLALKQFELLNDKRAIADCYKSIGQWYYNQGNRVDAIKYYYKAFGIYEDLKDKAMMASTQFNIGYTHQLQANFEEANNYYKRCLSIWKELGNKFQVARVSYSLADTYIQQKQYNTSLENSTYALQILQNINNVSPLLPRTINLIGRAHEEIGATANELGDEVTATKNYADALQSYKEALAAAQKISDKERIAVTTGFLGSLYIKMKKYDLAREHLENSLAFFIGTKNYPMLTYDYVNLAHLDSIQGNYKEAYGHYRAYMEIRDSAFINDVEMRKLSEAKGRYEFIKREDSLKFEEQLTAEKLKQQQLLSVQQQQKLQLQQASLRLSNQQKELNRLAFLRAESRLEAEQSQRQEQEKQLVIVEKEKALQQSNLKLKITELSLKEKEIKAKNMQRNLIIAGAFAIMIFGGAVWRNNRNRQKAYNLLEKQKMRTQIASDLHDDIGSTLTSISYYSELVKMQLPEENWAVKNTLDKIGNNARTIVNTMSDIVWVINPDNDLNGNLIRRMRNHASELCNDRNIQCCFEANDEIKDLKLNMQQRKNLYFIFKEALHNALKYAGCSKIDVDLLQTDHEIQLVVKDNGKGFHLKQVSEGNGLTNMKRRAEEINAILNIEAHPNIGTSVSLKLKIT
jgi:two-component system, NarL family, sensor histidine kinase UhpB